MISSPPLQTLLFVVLLWQMACARLEPRPPESGLLPAFGSVWAGTVLLDRDRSDRTPSISLQNPGNLPGHWLSSGVVESVEVSHASPEDFVDPRYCEYFPHDCFAIKIAAKRYYRFIAAYESFLLYGMDVTGDGIDELLLEYGEGRGTSVHTKHLTVLQLTNEGAERLLSVQLTGYVTGEFRGDPPSWVRRYGLVRSPRSASTDVIVWLLPPPYVPRFVGNAEVLAILQHPRLVFRYRPDFSTYELAEANLVPLR